MRIEQIDGYCDLFEQRLKGGVVLSAEQFLEEFELPQESQLVAELEKLQQEYKQQQAAVARTNLESVARHPATVAMPSDGTGTSVGNYRLLQKIGEGGMGIVYMAEQTKPVRRRVALKIIKPGMDSKEVLARFEAERQALALMDHPNIARVLDAGTTDSGQPFFVMELVKGIPITRYCDDEKLSARERLALCLPICQAIQHAHQKGIIHRDIKPSNILVAQYDDEAVPKIIDFGLAKAISHRLTEKTLFTEYGRIVGTIDYMSPEQSRFNQLDVDTRTDIYSMGVLLYELLTGETPFDKKRLREAAIEELLRIIREEEPPAPSIKLSSSASLPTIASNRHTESKKLTSLVRGELDWIVMKALEKDRRRRYETAHDLRRDIQRYLDDEPVVAGPPSASYRLRKLASRHKGALSATALIIIALFSLTIATVAAVKNREVVEQRNIAEEAEDNERLQREAAEHIQYVSGVLLADMHWRDGREHMARSMLTGCPTRDRDWEWEYLFRLFNQERNTLPSLRINASEGAESYVQHFDAAGDSFVFGDGDGIVFAHDLNASSGSQIIGRMSGPISAVTMTETDDGSVVAAASDFASETGTRQSEVTVWSAEGQKSLHETMDLDVSALAFAPGGLLLGAACGGREISSGRVLIWNIDGDGDALAIPTDRPVRHIAFSSNGMRLAVIETAAPQQSDSVAIHEIPSGHKIKTIDLGRHLLDESDTREGFVSCFSSDGLLLVGESAHISIWSPETGECLAELRGHTDAIRSLAFNPKETRLVSAADDGSVMLWDWTPNSRVSRVRVPPEGEYHPRNRKWSVLNDLPLLTLQTDSRPRAAFSSDGNRLFAGSDRAVIQIWNGEPRYESPSSSTHASR